MSEPSTGRAARIHARLPLWKKVVFALTPVIALTVGTEFVLRLIADQPIEAVDGRATHMAHGKFPAQYDRDLGYIPIPNSSTRRLWGKQITLGDYGLRTCPGITPSASRPMLAVGDSFTFGAEVGDDETWPCILSTRLGEPVLNGGVFGYGLDQAVLRAEKLVAEIHPTMLIVSFTPADIFRCEMAIYYSYKPYFEIHENQLVLRKDHLPPKLPPRSLLRVALHHSYLADAILSRVAPDWWLLSDRAVRAHRDGPEVACLLMDRVARLARENTLDVLIVAQPEPPIVWGFDQQDSQVRQILGCSQGYGLPSINLIQAFRHLMTEDPAVDGRFFNPEGVHMSSEGNEWVAGEIEQRLHELGDDDAATDDR